MALTIGSLTYDLAGSKNVVRGTIAFDSSYPTGGESLTPANVGLSTITNLSVSPKSGYTFEYDYTNQKLLAYLSAGFTPAGTNGTSAVTGTAAAQTFTGSVLSDHAHNVLVKGGASGGIDEPIGVEGTDQLAKDAATDRTILGADSATKGGVIAGSAGTPAGTNSTSALTATAAAQTFTGSAVAAAVMAEVANATNLSTLTGVRFEAIGY